MVRESGFRSFQYLPDPDSLSLLSFRLCMKMGPQMALYKINPEAALGYKLHYSRNSDVLDALDEASCSVSMI